MNPADAAQKVDQLPLLQKLFSIGWESRAFSDVTVCAFGQQYDAHRILLCQSPYFERLLRGHWSESESNILELSFDDPHIGPDSFFKALQFLYGQTVHLDEENVHGTLATGCFLALEPLCDRCVDFVADNLTLRTFERFYLFCSRFDYGVYSRKVRELCLDFLRMHACWEARNVIKDLSPVDREQLLADDVLWVPTEVERFLMMQDAFASGDDDDDMAQNSPMSCQTMFSGTEEDEDFSQLDCHPPLSYGRAFRHILTSIRFEHFPERSLKHLMSEEHSPLVDEAIQFGYRIQNQIRKVLCGKSLSLAHMFKRPFLTSSKSKRSSNATTDIVNRSFRVGIEFEDLSDVYKTKGLDSYEYFYAGSLWRIHMVQRRSVQRPESNEYIGVFIHRRPAPNTYGSWADQRDCVDACLRVRIGWGTYKVDKTCQGKFEPDSWNSFGWPQFVRKSTLARSKQPDGALRLVLNITLTL